MAEAKIFFMNNWANIVVVLSIAVSASSMLYWIAVPRFQKKNQSEFGKKEISEKELAAFRDYQKNSVSSESGGRTAKEKRDNWADFLMALFISICVPFVPVLITWAIGTLENKIWMQSIFIYVLLVAAQSPEKMFRHFSIVVGVAATIVYGMMEGEVLLTTKHGDGITVFFIIVSGAVSVSHGIVAWDKHIKKGLPLNGEVY